LGFGICLLTSLDFESKIGMMIHWAAIYPTISRLNPVRQHVDVRLDKIGPDLRAPGQKQDGDEQERPIEEYRFHPCNLVLASRF